MQYGVRHQAPIVRHEALVQTEPPLVAHRFGKAVEQIAVQQAATGFRIAGLIEQARRDDIERRQAADENRTADHAGRNDHRQLAVTLEDLG